MWLEDAARLRQQGVPFAVVTVTEVRGHAPRGPGAKMLVSADRSWGSIGGGNLEITATQHARAMLSGGDRDPQTLQMRLSEHAPTEHGQQCCGGVVTLLVEPVLVPATVAVFGLGHVGYELARILSRLEITLHLTDSRPQVLSAAQHTELTSGPATVHLHHPAAPESVLTAPDLLADDAHVLVLTHDHAEDIAICDAALRRPLGSIGLIGSRAKWSRFQQRLLAEGHDDAALERITCPIGAPDLTGKHPAVIAISVAADLLRVLQKTDRGGLA